MVHMKSSKTKSRKDTRRPVWDLRWVREPQQERSARTRSNILDAAEALLEKYGLDSLTIATIANHANCSPGSIYHYFEDKQTLIYAVLDRVAAETYATAVAGLKPDLWEGVPLLDIIEGYLRYTLKMGRQFSGIAQAQGQLALKDEHIRKRVQSNMRKISAMILRLLRQRENEIGHPDPRHAIPMVYQTIRAVLNQRRQQRWLGVSDYLARQGDEAFIREMVEMARGYLQIKS